MLIFTGTANSPARSSQGLATVILPPAARPDSFKPAPADESHWILDGIGLHGLSNDERKAVVKPARAALSDLGPEAKAAVKILELWESSASLAAALRAADAGWTTKLGKAVGTAAGLAAVVRVAFPPIAANAAFRFVDGTLTLGKLAASVHEEAMKEPESFFGIRSAS